MSWKISSFGKYGKPLYPLSNDKLLIYKNGWLDTYTNNEKRKHLCKLPMSFLLRNASRVRILERILRTEPRVAILEKNGYALISHHGNLLTLDLNTNQICARHAFRQGMLNPIYITKISDVRGFDDCVVYGEYWGNPNHDDVCIYAKYSNTESWSVIYRFTGEKEITHIHNIIPDKSRGCVYILTGDTDAGSGIWEARNNFRDVKPLLVGKQKYRSCVAVPIENGIVFATDTPFEGNGIYRIIFDHDGDVSSPELLAELPGSVIYGTIHQHSLIFSTTVEPDPRYLGIRYMITSRVGEGIKDKFSHLFVWNEEEGLSEVHTFKKDIYPMGLCQFGVVMFASDDKDIYAYSVAVSKDDGKMFKFMELGK